MTEEQIIKAICESEQLDCPGKPVIGIIQNEQFTITGVLRGGAGCSLTRVCISTKDRERLMSVIDWKRRKKLGSWTKREHEMYSGFYIPLNWLDSVEVQKREEVKNDG
jgi:hypothetical protein